VPRLRQCRRRIALFQADPLSKVSKQTGSHLFFSFSLQYTAFVLDFQSRLVQSNLGCDSRVVYSMVILYGLL